MPDPREPDAVGPTAVPPRPDPGGRDADRLDDELAAGDGDWAEDLRALLTPGAGIGRRTAVSVDRTLRGRSVGGTALELLGVGWWTVRLLLSDDPPSADGKGAWPDGDDGPGNRGGA